MMLLNIVINAVILMVAIKAFTDEDVGFGSSAILGIGASIIAVLLLFGLANVIGGIPALIVASIITAALIGVAVSAMYGIEIKRSMLVGVIFMVANIAVGFFFSAVKDRATATAELFESVQSVFC